MTARWLIIRGCTKSPAPLDRDVGRNGSQGCNLGSASPPAGWALLDPTGGAGPKYIEHKTSNR
jgi:hypothetical protein